MAEEYSGGLDDVIARMERDDFEEQVKAAPTDYAKMRGLYPQRVYKAMRDKKLAWERCDCGRKVIVIYDADVLFGLIQELDQHE